MTFHDRTVPQPARAAQRAEMPTPNRAETRLRGVRASVRRRLAAIAAATWNPGADDIRQMIPDDTLRRLARSWPEAQRGEIPEELQIELCTILPDLMGELLARRLAEGSR